MLARFLESKHLPWILGIAAAAIMLPAMKTGLMMDDLIQRIPQLEPSQIPPGLYRTGAVPDNTGKLSTVLFETFGLPRNREHLKTAKDYGVIPWWIDDEARVSLWRPFTAFTHWIDYRLFPDSPALMHAHNIVWFAAIVFLTTVIYRKIIALTWIAGLAALMFVLDSKTYFPVMFVANRGFLIAMCFGLLCFYAHHKWRTENSAPAAFLSVIFFSLSLLSNEAGVSTFAFILAYALVLDEASLPKRFLSLPPAILIIIIWRIVYQSLGYGVSGIGAGYLDPGHEPLKFLYHLPISLIVVVAGQLSSLPPDIMAGFNDQWLRYIVLFYAVFITAAILLLLPVIRKNTLARFWLAVMLFAAIPIVAAPMGKNFGFVAIAAFGLIAVFADDLIKNRSSLLASYYYKCFAWALCIFLLIVHIPVAAFLRYTAPKVTPVMFGLLVNSSELNSIPLSGDSHVVIVNAPCMLSACIMPFNSAYYGRPVPQSIRSLASAYTALEIKRTDDKTLVITSKETDIFTSAQNSTLHFSHIFAIADRSFLNSRIFEKKREFVLKGLTIEVLRLDAGNLPKELAFTFDVPLENKKFCWLQFNWTTFSYEPFRLPVPGETVITKGPGFVSFCESIRYLSGGLF